MEETVQAGDYRYGRDLIVSIDGVALGFSDGCKIVTSAETGSRATKERGAGKYDQKYVKKLSETITASGFEVKDGRLGYDKLRERMNEGKTVTANYAYVGETDAWQGQYLITNLELDGQATDDAKYSITLENSGAVRKVTLAAGATRTEGNSAEDGDIMED